MNDEEEEAEEDVITRVKSLCSEIIERKSEEICLEICQLNCTLTGWSSKEQRSETRKKLRRLARRGARGEVRRETRREARRIILDEDRGGYEEEHRRLACGYARKFARRLVRGKVRRVARRVARQVVRMARRESIAIFHEGLSRDEDDSSDNSENSYMTVGSDISNVSAFSDVSVQTMGSLLSSISCSSLVSIDQFDLEQYDDVASLQILCRRFFRDNYTDDQISRLPSCVFQFLNFSNVA